jgi:D-3-phosphoglycerate dehydrogenase
LTAGIIGFGRFGKKVAQRYKALEMKVVAYDPYVKKQDAEAIGVQLTDLQTLLKEM